MGGCRLVSCEEGRSGPCRRSVASCVRSASAKRTLWSVFFPAVHHRRSMMVPLLRVVLVRELAKFCGALCNSFVSISFAMKACAALLFARELLAPSESPTSHRSLRESLFPRLEGRSSLQQPDVVSLYTKAYFPHGQPMVSHTSPKARRSPQQFPSCRALCHQQGALWGPVERERLRVSSVRYSRVAFNLDVD